MKGAKKDRTASGRSRARLLGVLLVVALMTGLSGAAAVTAAAATAARRVVCSVSNKTPVSRTPVTVTARVLDSRGRGIRGAKVVFTWGFATRVTVRATTDSTGRARSRRNIGRAPVGRRVVVSVKATSGGKTVTGSTSFTPRLARKITVVEKDLAFTPGTVTVSAGDIVRWVNRDAFDHRVVIAGRDLGLQHAGVTVSWTASGSGTVNYRCSIHPLMKGKVIVR